MEVRDSINRLTGKIKEDFQIAWQQTLQQGNLYPMVEFYTANESELKNKYGLSLNELMGLDPTKLENVAAITSQNNNSNNRNGAGQSRNNPMIDLTNQTSQRPLQQTGNMLSWFTTVLIGGGLFMVYKSFNK